MKLVDPTLNLFTYTLKQGLGVEESETRKTYRRFLAGLPKQLHKKLGVSFIPEKKQKFLAVDKVTEADLTFTGDLHNHRVEGRYRRWNDTDNYQLLFSGYVVNGKYSTGQVIELIKSLQYLTPELPKLENIGQTWMLSGCLESGTDAEAAELAKKAYKNVFKKDGNPQGSGKFLGGKVAEFWGDKIEDNLQLLVILYPDDAAFRECAVFYEHWLDLLCFRHKIIWAYENSLLLKERLVKNYNQIVAIRNTSRLTLPKLLEAMGKLSDFAIDLNYLELQYSTIKVNLEKYENKLAEMQAKARPTDDLQFLQVFCNDAKTNYPKQIKKDIDDFRPCLEILQSLTDTIRGTVEIRKAESDRNFQNIVGIVGVGLSTGGTVASASANYKTEIEANPALNTAINTLFPLFEPGSGLRIIMGFTIISGVAASLLTAIIIAVWPRIFRR